MSGWFPRALATGSLASMLSALVMAMRGASDDKSIAGPLNGPSQWIWGRRAARTRRASVRHTVLGYAIHHASATFWALIYETFAATPSKPKRLRHAMSDAVALTTAAFVVDYGLTPKRLQPGFENHLQPASIAAVYASFAAGLVLATWMRGGISDVRRCRSRTRYTGVAARLRRTSRGGRKRDP